MRKFNEEQIDEPEVTIKVMNDELQSEGRGHTRRTMTPSQQCKAAGLSSLAVVSKLTGVSPQTLSNWHKHKPELFRVVLIGCKQLTEE